MVRSRDAAWPSEARGSGRPGALGSLTDTGAARASRADAGAWRSAHLGRANGERRRRSWSPPVACLCAWAPPAAPAWSCAAPRHAAPLRATPRHSAPHRAATHSVVRSDPLVHHSFPISELPFLTYLTNITLTRKTSWLLEPHWEWFFRILGLGLSILINVYILITVTEAFLLKTSVLLG